MSSDSKSTVQHFYLRLPNNGQLNKHGVPTPPDHLGRPVGVIAFKMGEDASCVTVSASMVSRKDPFEKKKGVAKAVGRLDTPIHRLHMRLDEFRKTTPAELAARLGLYTRSGNYFSDVDWVKADKTKASAIESFEARLAQTPA